MVFGARKQYGLGLNSTEGRSSSKLAHDVFIALLDNNIHILRLAEQYRVILWNFQKNYVFNVGNMVKILTHVEQIASHCP